MDELRYAIRTATHLIKPLGTVHLVAPDFPQTSLEGMAQAESVRTGRPAKEILKEHQSSFDLYTDPIDGSQRAGQRPWWLNPDSPSVLVGADAITQSSAASPTPQLRLHHDWSLFRPAHSSNQAAEMVTAHKLAVLPTFNSMAVESAINPAAASAGAGGWTGTSDTLFFSNDDFLILRPVGHHDVLSPL